MFATLPNPPPAIVARAIVSEARAARTKPTDAYVVGAHCRRPAGGKPRDYYCRVYAYDPTGQHKHLLCRYAEIVGPPFVVKRLTVCTLGTNHLPKPLPPA